jgi:circadian clock protein KaiB
LTDYEFTIFIAGDTPRSERAVASIRRLCAEHLPGRYALAVVDVLDEPQVAEAHNVIATPTVVRVAPAPQRRVLGDLSDPTKLLQALDIVPDQRLPDAPGA